MIASRRDEYVSITQAATRINTSTARIRQWLHRKPIRRKGRLLSYRDLERTEWEIRHTRQRRLTSVA